MLAARALGLATILVILAASLPASAASAASSKGYAEFREDFDRSWARWALCRNNEQTLLERVVALEKHGDPGGMMAAAKALARDFQNCAVTTDADMDRLKKTLEELRVSGVVARGEREAGWTEAEFALSDANVETFQEDWSQALREFQNAQYRLREIEEN